MLGCAVNGIGEASHADFGITGAKNEGLIFAHGEPLRKVPQDRLVDELFAEIDKSLSVGRVVVDEHKAAEGAAWLSQIEEENAGELTPERIAAMEAAAAAEQALQRRHRPADGRRQRLRREARGPGRGRIAHRRPPLHQGVGGRRGRTRRLASYSGYARRTSPNPGRIDESRSSPRGNMGLSHVLSCSRLGLTRGRDRRAAAPGQPCTRVHRGVYAVGHPRLAGLALDLAAVLACGDGAVAATGAPRRCGAYARARAPAST